MILPEWLVRDPGSRGVPMSDRAEVQSPQLSDPPVHSGPGRCPINTDRAPAAVGPYSQAIAAQGPFIFTAGQLGLDPTTGQLVGDDVESQTAQALRNLTEILAAGGTSLANVVKTTIFLADMQDFATVNEIYRQFFNTDAPPARSCVQVAQLPKQARVEIEAIAWHP